MPAKKRDRSYKGTREPELVKARQDAFIAAYGECGSIRAACQASEVSRSAYYGWMNNNVQGFKEKFATARDMFREMLQDIAVERVKTQKPNDNPVLLIALLNAHYPELYKKDAQVTNAGKEIMEEIRDEKKLSDDLQEKMKSFLEDFTKGFAGSKEAA